MYKFTEPFKTGALPDIGGMDKNRYDKLLLASYYNTMGCIYAGAKPPDGYIEGIKNTADHFGITASEENFDKLYNEMFQPSEKSEQNHQT